MGADADLVHWGIVVLLIAVPSCVATAGTEADRPQFPGRTWQGASPESQGVDPATLKAAIEYMDSHFGAGGARQLVVVRNGRLIWKGPDCDAYHEFYSPTKVFASTLLGLLIADGRCPLDTRAFEHLPDLAEHWPGYAKLTLRHLASMTGGYHGKVANVGPGQTSGDPIVYVTMPDKPAFVPPGSQVATRNGGKATIYCGVSRHLEPYGVQPGQGFGVAGHVQRGTIRRKGDPEDVGIGREDHVVCVCGRNVILYPVVGVTPRIAGLVPVDYCRAVWGI